jgi:hypothetical protein
MKATDIPNGYVVLGPSGQNILVDFDDKGNAGDTATEITLSNWSVDIMVNGRILPTVIVLVHTVKGDGQMLVKCLAALQIRIGGVPIKIEDIAKNGMLTRIANDLWKEYVNKTLDAFVDEAKKLGKPKRKGG